jgi:hypothetical protein
MTEPLGDRIIEVPMDERQTETLRSPRVRFVAYVPNGSPARGESRRRPQRQRCVGSGGLSRIAATVGVLEGLPNYRGASAREFNVT